jgi:hypothetical protein
VGSLGLGLGRVRKHHVILGVLGLVERVEAARTCSSRREGGCGVGDEFVDGPLVARHANAFLAPRLIITTRIDKSNICRQNSSGSV